MFAVAFEGKSAKITEHSKRYKKILKNAYFYGKVVLSLSEVEKKTTRVGRKGNNVFYESNKKRVFTKS